MAQIELHLLERALDEKRRTGMNDRPEALQGMTRCDTDQELLSDAEVAQPHGMTPLFVARAGGDSATPATRYSYQPCVEVRRVMN